VNLAATSKSSWIIGTLSLADDPHDGHAPEAQLNHVRSLLEKDRVREVFVDRDLLGHKHEGKEAVHVDLERRGSIPKSLWQFMKRKAAIEMIIGHMKNEHRLERNRHKVAHGDAVNASRSAVAMSFGKLLTWIGQFWLFLGSFFPPYQSPAFFLAEVSSGMFLPHCKTSGWQW
jgi:IS5 family transposase